MKKGRKAGGRRGEEIVDQSECNASSRRQGPKNRVRLRAEGKHDSCDEEDDGR